MIHLNIERRYQGLGLESGLNEAAKATLNIAAAPDVGISIAIVGDAEIRKLNSQFLGEDRATDVLSFPAGGTSDNYLGDVIISYPRAAAQAKAGGHRVEDELQLLAVHGILHLLGFDHDTPGDKDRMWSVQSNVLARVGVEISTAHAEEPHSG
ncbi:MAG: rRNA maturation RNase YbeY [Anaerolineales bacterium]